MLATTSNASEGGWHARGSSQSQHRPGGPRYRKAGGRFLVCPICFDARRLDKVDLIEVAELGGTVPMWQWIGDQPAVTFSY